MHDGSKRHLFADAPGSFSDDAEEFDVISMTGAEGLGCHRRSLQPPEPFR